MQELTSSPAFLDSLFAACALLILGASAAVVLARNPIRATLSLILSFLPTAVVYIMLQAAFVGILQILVYAGAIMMLFTFVIMMINPAPKAGETPGADGPRDGSRTFSAAAALALLAGAGALILPVAYRAAAAAPAASAPGPGFGSLASISNLLFRDPIHNPLTVSFELISFLILVGIIAALNLSRRKSAHPAGRGAGAPARAPAERIPK